MGVINKITCLDCSTSWECNTGHGMRHGRLENILPLYSVEQQEAIRELVGAEHFPKYTFGYKIAWCEHCEELLSVPVLSLKEEATFIGDCPKCNQEVEAVDMEKLSCPMCGHSNWKYDEIGMWD